MGSKRGPSVTQDLPLPPLVERVSLKNYKSIGACDVRLGPLTILVGRNAAGKSNFLDALRFVSDSLRTSVDHAMRDRNGIKEVRRRSSGHPNHFSIRLEFRLDPKNAGTYHFRIGARPKGGFEIQDEECTVLLDGKRHSFRVQSGSIVGHTCRHAPAAAPDRLYLVAASGSPEFRPVYDALVNMGFYNLNPDSIRLPQTPSAQPMLQRDGSNLCTVMRRLGDSGTGVLERIEGYLSLIAPGVSGVDVVELGRAALYETLEFRQDAGTKSPWRFTAGNMSDGTLRALGILVALFQGWDDSTSPARLIGIEEPETALHPAAAKYLRDALFESSARTQVIITSHSPDLLDDHDVDHGCLRIVESHAGETRIEMMDSASRDAVRQHLFTAGELLRLGQMAIADLAESTVGQE